MILPLSATLLGRDWSAQISCNFRRIVIPAEIIGRQVDPTSPFLIENVPGNYLVVLAAVVRALHGRQKYEGVRSTSQTTVHDSLHVRKAVDLQEVFKFAQRTYATRVPGRKN